ncbi:hypothetical protein [Chryseobacterium bernardetii]|uniref:hypothetical protein n=1 Tax=Chryseobacterium bernardetii TaxID=1241978 RepID=UPI0016286026|nr:hypothetical protein [Chryseobacterium bernardetii]
MAKKIIYTEEEKLILRYIADNIVFTAFKNKLLNFAYSLGDFNSNIENIESQYLWSFQVIIDTLINKEDAENNAEDTIFEELQDIFLDNVDEHEFKLLLGMDIENLSVKIFNEWNLALKAIRSTYETQKS